MSTRPWEAKMMGDHRRIDLMKERIEADEALMPMLLDALESCDPGDFSTGHVIHASYNETLVEAAITALRKRLESSK